MTKFTDYPKVSLLEGTETFLVAQNGSIKQCSIADIAAAAPNSAGVYPDVPMNRITIKRFSAQASGTVVATDNLEMMNRIFSLFFPCLSLNLLLNQALMLFYIIPPMKKFL